MKEAIKNKVVSHGQNIIKMFNLSNDTNELQLCRKLRRIEKEARILMTDQCNGDLNHKSTDEILFMEEEILNKLDKILNFKSQNIPVFLNGDPRGYTLKIKDDYLRKVRDKTPLYSDMGGYGIIAPDLSEGGF